jgi:hypothetical protein
MSRFHCSCGFAIDHPEELADHLHQAFGADNDIGIDGRTHFELADADPAKLKCACGLTASDIADLDDHLLIVFITPDSIGTDGKTHALADPSTPDRWYVRRAIDE